MYSAGKVCTQDDVQLFELPSQPGLHFSGTAKCDDGNQLGDRPSDSRGAESGEIEKHLSIMSTVRTMEHALNRTIGGADTSGNSDLAACSVWRRAVPPSQPLCTTAFQAVVGRESLVDGLEWPTYELLNLKTPVPLVPSYVEQS